MDASTSVLAICRPLGDRVVVMRDAPKKETDGGVLVPDTAAGGHRQTGTVVSVGPGVKDPRLTSGVRVVVSGYAGLTLQDDTLGQDDPYVILREDDVQAVIPGPEEVPAGPAYHGYGCCETGACLGKL